MPLQMLCWCVLAHQVQKVLKILACEGGLRADHLELLWALTEKARACVTRPSPARMYNGFASAAFTLSHA